MISRRQSLKLASVGGAATLAAPAMLLADPQPDVRVWRFGVWEIIDRYDLRHGQKYYSCRCDCGEERVVGLNQLLSTDALSCDHKRPRGLFCISPDGCALPEL
jgi:hypothetical protein